MTAPKTDESGIRQTIRALKAAGYNLHLVDNGEDQISVTTEKDAIAEVMAVDDAHLFVIHPEQTGTTWVRFVMGNEPYEVIADHGVSLSPALDPLTEKWQED